MKKSVKGYLLPVILSAGLMLGVAGRPAAHPSTQVVPPYKVR